MALKITTQIGTDKGITSEAYVRITDYQISKNGHANFRIELFQNQEDSILLNNNLAINYGVANNQQIGNYIFVDLSSVISEEINGAPVLTKIIDLSSAQGIDIFTFGYTHLKFNFIVLCV